MRKSDQGTYKKIEEYSYSLSNGIGKGYSSQVYKGKNDSTGISLIYFRRKRSYKSYWYALT